MHPETIIIGQTEYTAMKMNAFEANRILLRLNKIILPVIGGLTKGKQGASINILDADLSEVTGIIAENLTEEIMDTIVLPMFTQSRVYMVEKKVFIKDGMSINQAFTADNLFDLYELIWEVLKLNFSSFFAKTAGRFGNLTAGVQTAKSLPVN
ncbi:hypothetical protein UFOVP1309_35 [uncultured Caudovirales phage]|uniref:Uncharacterized protein n=1 Tax=uncultured Caudovirales phage TaxID=2100421 RepID=A0A6J5RZR2_9CAUD|nr:hypothetical protein UFOVP1309_35 [uncultured Caudovirales phage]